MTEDVLTFSKNEDTAFQPPGCRQENLNGFKLPPWIKVPIPASELHHDYLIDWSATKAVVKFILTGNEEHLDERAIQENDASFDVIDTDSEESVSNHVDIEMTSG